LGSNQPLGKRNRFNIKYFTFTVLLNKKFDQEKIPTQQRIGILPFKPKPKPNSTPTFKKP